jgi:catechol 2,3-dioxygenase-like lactoylglutathione lyase family enzyme
MTIEKPFSVAVMVSDAKKSAQWYKEKLGFESETEGHWVTVFPKGSEWKIHLCQGKLEPGNTGIGFYSRDVGKTAAEMKSRGVKFTLDVTKSRGEAKAMFEDPDGNVFWLTEGEP